MLGYFVPAVVVAAAMAGAQLTFERLWLTLLMGLGVGILLPIGDLHGKPLIMQLISLPETLRSRRRRKRRRHLYYSP